MAKFRVGLKILSEIPKIHGSTLPRLRSFSEGRRVTEWKTEEQWAVRPSTVSTCTGKRCDELKKTKSWMSIFRTTKDTANPHTNCAPPQVLEDTPLWDLREPKSKQKGLPCRNVAEEERFQEIVCAPAALPPMVKGKRPKCSEIQPASTPPFPVPKDILVRNLTRGETIQPKQIQKTNRLPFDELRPPQPVIRKKSFSFRTEDEITLRPKNTKGAVTVSLPQPLWADVKEVELPKSLYTRYKSVELDDTSRLFTMKEAKNPADKKHTSLQNKQTPVLSNTKHVEKQLPYVNRVSKAVRLKNAEIPPPVVQRIGKLIEKPKFKNPCNIETKCKEENITEDTSYKSKSQTSLSTNERVFTGCLTDEPSTYIRYSPSIKPPKWMFEMSKPGTNECPLVPHCEQPKEPDHREETDGLNFYKDTECCPKVANDPEKKNEKFQFSEPTPISEECKLQDHLILMPEKYEIKPRAKVIMDENAPKADFKDYIDDQKAKVGSRFDLLYKKDSILFDLERVSLLKQPISKRMFSSFANIETKSSHRIQSTVQQILRQRSSKKNKQNKDCQPDCHSSASGEVCKKFIRQSQPAPMDCTLCPKKKTPCCAEMTLPCCKPAMCPPHCHSLVKPKEPCLKRMCPKKSYSECHKEVIKKKFSECDCWDVENCNPPSGKFSFRNPKCGTRNYSKWAPKSQFSVSEKTSLEKSSFLKQENKKNLSLDRSYSSSKGNDKDKCMDKSKNLPEGCGRPKIKSPDDCDLKIEKGSLKSWEDCPEPDPEPGPPPCEIIDGRSGPMPDLCPPEMHERIVEKPCPTVKDSPSPKNPCKKKKCDENNLGNFKNFTKPNELTLEYETQSNKEPKIRKFKKKKEENCPEECEKIEKDKKKKPQKKNKKCENNGDLTEDMAFSLKRMGSRSKPVGMPLSRGMGSLAGSSLKIPCKPEQPVEQTNSQKIKINLLKSKSSIDLTQQKNMITTEVAAYLQKSSSFSEISKREHSSKGVFRVYEIPEPGPPPELNASSKRFKPDVECPGECKQVKFSCSNLKHKCEDTKGCDCPEGILSCIKNWIFKKEKKKCEGSQREIKCEPKKKTEEICEKDESAIDSSSTTQKVQKAALAPDVIKCSSSRNIQTDNSKYFNYEDEELHLTEHSKTYKMATGNQPSIDEIDRMAKLKYKPKNYKIKPFRTQSKNFVTVPLKNKSKKSETEKPVGQKSFQTATQLNLIERKAPSLIRQQEPPISFINNTLLLNSAHKIEKIKVKPSENLQRLTEKQNNILSSPKQFPRIIKLNKNIESEDFLENENTKSNEIENENVKELKEVMKNIEMGGLESFCEENVNTCQLQSKTTDAAEQTYEPVAVALALKSWENNLFNFGSSNMNEILWQRHRNKNDKIQELIINTKKQFPPSKGHGKKELKKGKKVPVVITDNDCDICDNITKRSPEIKKKVKEDTCSKARPHPDACNPSLKSGCKNCPDPLQNLPMQPPCRRK